MFDNPTTVEPLQEFLNVKGYETSIVWDRLESLQKIRQEDPHAIFLDAHLFKLGTLEILRQIQAISREINVIIVINVDEETIGRQAIDAGAFDCIVKPLNLPYLKQSLFYATITHELAGPIHFNQCEGPNE
jgi:DNA-binding response OmpR family regulator